MQSNWFESQSHKRLVLILAFCAFFFLMFGNNFVSLTHPDEVFYAQTSKEMIQHNSWFVPLIFDQPQFEKPILFYLLTAIGFKLFGISPFMARFWPALFGIIGVITVYYLSWFLFGRKRLSFFAGLILLTSLIYLALSRAVLTDMVFSIFVAIAMSFFYFSYSHQTERKSLFCGYLFTGLAVLTKGLLGFLFPLTSLLIFVFFVKDWKFLKSKNHGWGIVIFFLVALPWHIMMLMKFGPWFIEEYWTNVHVRRLFESEHPKLNNLYFYPGLMFVGVLPWTIYFVASLKLIVQSLRNSAPAKKSLIFLLSWIVAVFIFVEPAASKLASYIFPVFPAIAVLIAFYVDDVLSRVKVQRRIRLMGGVMSFILFVGAIVGSVVAKQYPGVIVDMTPIYTAVILTIITSFLIGLFAMKGDLLKMFLAHTGVTVTLLAGLLLSRPDIEVWVSCKDAVEMFKEVDQSNTPILSSKFYVRGVRYYTDRPMAVIAPGDKGFWSPHPVPFLNSDDKIANYINQAGSVYALVKEGDVEHLTRMARNQLWRVTEFGGVGGKYILKIEK
jgi:4-amino-4-deoxy-L-arabinose transferase-like glycosyltransferase